MMTDKQRALIDLHAKVQELMDDMKVRAKECIDRLQASGADIVGDHLENSSQDKIWLTPRNFMIAFTEEIKSAAGCQSSSDTKERRKIIKNYERMM